MSVPSQAWVGRSIERVEDAPLLTGRGRFIDDLGVATGTLHAAILRSPHAHARIREIRTGPAQAAPGVAAVVTGADVVRLAASLPVAVKTPMKCWPIALERVRYVGEPVAVVVATDRYLAEDALDLIEVDYDLLSPVIDPAAAIEADAPILHDGLRSNIASERSFRYGDPESAFASAAHRIGVDVRYPRNSCTPIETYGVVASYDPHEDAYDILSNFQGPFSIHAVMARALKVPGNRLRLRTPPNSGGSFGVKQAVFPYLVLMGVAARMAGRPVKWIEDRLEHLTASVSATNRIIRLDAAVDRDGRVRALAWDQIEDVRGPHACAGARHALPHARQPHRRLRHPPRLRAQPGGRHEQDPNWPQPRFRGSPGLLCARAPDAGHRAPAEARPARGDPPQPRCRPASFPTGPQRVACSIPATISKRLEIAVRDGGHRRAARRAARRRAVQGRLYGIGFAAVVEPSVSNMGYITTALTPRGTRCGRARRTARRRRPRSRSIRSARLRPTSPPCRKGKGIAPCWLRSLPMSSA